MTFQHSNKTWLILSHAFNMDGRAASQTITDKMRFFANEGVESIVFSAVTGHKDTEYEHHQILPWGPGGLRFDLRHLLRRKIGKGLAYRLIMLLVSLVLAPFMVLERVLLGLQSQWSWAVPATFFGLLTIWRRKPSIIFSTGGAYSAHLAGYWLKKLTGLPWIVEVHDPLVIPGTTPKNRNQRFMAKLEKIICQHADFVWWFTDGALASAKARTPELADKGVCLLPGANPPTLKRPYQRGEQLVFAHFGSLSDTRSLAPFLSALEAELQRNPAMQKQVRVEIYGGDLDSQGKTVSKSPVLAPLVHCFGRLEYCPETGLSGRERVMARMHEVDCLVMMHGEVPECREYIPSKLYEYFWVGRPILGITHENPQLDDMVRAHGGFVAATLQPAQIQEAIRTVYQQWSTQQLLAAPGKPMGCEDCAHAIVERCDALLARAR